MTSEKKSPDAGQKALADKAMAMKSGAPDPARPDPGRTADEGVVGAPPDGGADAEGQRPVLERSRKVR